MPLPTATLTSTTATGDTVTGPGYPKFIVKGLPVSCVGDLVAGAACTGAIASSSSKVIIGGRPAATLTSTVTGVSAVGVPISTTVAVTSATNQLR